MNDPNADAGDLVTYECLECGEIVEAERRPKKCPECGKTGTFQNRAEELE